MELYLKGQSQDGGEEINDRSIRHLATTAREIRLLEYANQFSPFL